MLSSRKDRALDALRSFYDSRLDDVLSSHAHKNVAEHVLSLFRGVAREVPAYARFLEQVGVSASAIQSLDEFARLPCTTKDNYHRSAALRELCRGGTLETCDFVAVSSGSTGEPTVWPRFVSDEIGTAFRFEQVLADAMSVGARRTLGVICFALGSWVGGMYTTAACRHLAAKGYPLTLVTPGNNKAEILRVVRALGSLFDQVVLFGYPPFLKDVIDAGAADGLDWRRYAARLVTAGEVFSEEWRTLVCDRVGAPDPTRHVASLYGTADGGVLANETPISVGIRRFLADHPAAARELFGEARLPTLCQYDPFHRYFETEGAELVFSGDGGAPLIRYKILDRGGVIPFDRLLGFVSDHGGDPRGSVEPSTPVRELPFVFVFGRSSFALSFYGANVYPENISVGLERPAIARQVTGKFVMQIADDADQNKSLDIVVELAPNVAPSDALVLDVAKSVRAELERLNSEFLNYVPEDRRLPRIRLLPLGHPEYFPPGVKHRYTRN
jgi:phenylacetate-CoA ligase